jgi:hypothetical protein
MEISLAVLLIGAPFLLAVVFLLVRDKLTFGGLSPQQRKKKIQERSERSLNLWHVITLFCASVSLIFNAANVGHQQTRYRILEAIFAIFFVFRYYRKISEERIVNPSGSAPLR